MLRNAEFRTQNNELLYVNDRFHIIYSEWIAQKPLILNSELYKLLSHPPYGGYFTFDVSRIIHIDAVDNSYFKRQRLLK